MKTIRAQLLFGLLLGTLLCILVAGLTIYRMANHESAEQSDLQLMQIAAALPAQFVSDQVLPASEDPDENIAIQVWNPDGQPIYSSLSAARLPQQKTAGYHDVVLGGETLRVYTEVKRDRLVQISQPTSVRREFAAHMALRILTPLLVLLLALGVMIYFVVGKALAPLHSVARAVAGRSPQALQPLDAGGLPADLLPIVAALNRLLAKIDSAMSAQRIFVADAAHELRSPLTALKLQLQLAERATTDELRTLAFGKLHDRLDRSTHLVHQLLTLARHEPDQAIRAFTICDLHLLAQQAVIDHSTYAESKAIDLGVAGDSTPVRISGNVDGLGVMLSNLVDNALRYTQPGGQVDVYAGVENGQPLLRVTDNGPGVPAAERDRLFDRFYRPDGNTTWGSGLGMSIVKSIADLHGAEICLDENQAGTGLSVTVRLPAEAFHLLRSA